MDKDKYIEYLKYQKQYSKYTVISYEKDIDEYIEYLKIENIDYKDIEYSDIRFYLMYLKETKKEKNSSINRKLSAIRNFYNYLLNNKIIKNNPFTYINGLKKEQKLPRYFEYNELEQLFEIPDTKTSLGQRDLLILEILYATGIRVGELINIKIDDVNRYDQTINILGKGNKERIVAYGEYAKDILDKYIKDGREKINISNSKYLFLNNNGNQITERGIRYILDKIISKTTLQKKISPHMIRHTFATHLLNEGCDLLAVQKLLGHESISATQIYTHVSTDKLKEVYYNSFPRAKINSIKEGNKDGKKE